MNLNVCRHWQKKHRPSSIWHYDEEEEEVRFPCSEQQWEKRLLEFHYWRRNAADWLREISNSLLMTRKRLCTERERRDWPATPQFTDQIPNETRSDNEQNRLVESSEQLLHQIEEFVMRHRSWGIVWPETHHHRAKTIEQLFEKHLSVHLPTIDEEEEIVPVRAVCHRTACCFRFRLPWAECPPTRTNWLDKLEVQTAKPSSKEKNSSTTHRYFALLDFLCMWDVPICEDLWRCRALPPMNWTKVQLNRNQTNLLLLDLVSVQLHSS